MTYHPGKFDSPHHFTGTGLTPMTKTTKMPCYHVTTAQGEVYGVAATTVTDAKLFTQARLNVENSSDYPLTAKRVATWDAEYGTVLHY